MALPAIDRRHLLKKTGLGVDNSRSFEYSLVIPFLIVKPNKVFAFAVLQPVGPLAESAPAIVLKNNVPLCLPPAGAVRPRTPARNRLIKTFYYRQSFCSSQ